MEPIQAVKPNQNAETPENRKGKQAIKPNKTTETRKPKTKPVTEYIFLQEALTNTELGVSPVQTKDQANVCELKSNRPGNKTPWLGAAKQQITCKLIHPRVQEDGTR